jgi:hypothetical protein
MKDTRNHPLLKIGMLIFFAFTQADRLTAQIIIDEEPKMHYYENTTPRVKRFRDMKDMRDVLHKDKFLLGRKRILGNISYNTGRVVIDDGEQKHDEYRSALAFFLRVRFLEEFSVNATLYKDFNKKATAHWIEDYTYSIGRYNWRPGKFNYGYENYINNKYTDDWKTFTEHFQEGYYFLSYNHYPSKLSNYIRIDSTTSLRFIYFARYSIKYRDRYEQLHGGIFDGKSTIGAALRFTIFWNIYAEGALYYYPEETLKKQPWDPDYSYGFGYFDWRAFRISVTYGNWAVNRFPWNDKFYPNYGFLDGNFKIAFNWMW